MKTWNRTPQHELNDFLQSELYHTLGSYGTAVQRLTALEERMAKANARDRYDGLFPNQVVKETRVYNEALRTRLHHPDNLRGRRSRGERPARHPRPRLLDGGDVRDRWVLDFYRSAVLALECYRKDRRGERDGTRGTPRWELGHVLAVVHDPQRRGADREPAPVDLGAGTVNQKVPGDWVIRGRIDRSRRRLQLAHELLDGARGSDRCTEIVDDCLQVTHGDQLHTHAIGALADAHMCMHEAEHLTATTFWTRMRRRRDIDVAVDAMLRRSLMLNTFAYVVGRALPWIFAEDDAERVFVQRNYSACCDQLSPIYCVWIGSQLSLLALHRRAYTYLLMNKPAKAYNDFHKLRRLIRNFQRQLAQGIPTAPGAEDFLMGLDAFADHHSGRIYRDQHAHTAALQHLDRSAARLDRLERDGQMRDMLRNSRWRIELRMTQAKANYELGFFKRSLHCYACAWRSFLELSDTESLARANVSIVNELIEWLEATETDTDIDKVELQRRMEPLVEQFLRTRSPMHLRVMAAEIMMRVGHLLFILRLPLMQGERVVLDRRRRYPAVDHRLAHQCLLQAADLDPSSMLIAADLRKFEAHRLPADASEERAGSEPAEEDSRARDEFPSLKRQWPGGSGDFEQAARVVEYLLQSWLSDTYDKRQQNNPDPQEDISRRLLASFLAHTDSSNVKLAQVYRYLMQDSDQREVRRRRRSGPDAEPPAPQPGVEFVCLRRYSSFFPFLPRPSAFRVLGGGYFMRVANPGRDPATFGIVVDPGPHFVDNLYRCGYCLDDVHMVIATHDHADHIDALDALLTLLGYRFRYGERTFDKDNRLAIVGNASVCERYSYFNAEGRFDAVSVLSFEEWERAAAGEDVSEEVRDRFAAVRTCPGLRLRRVETVKHTDAAGNVAQGFLLTAGDPAAQTTMLFTSDTGHHPSLGGPGDPPADGSLPMHDALEQADLVVAHLSSVPLFELRELAAFDDMPEDVGPRTRRRTDQFQHLWERLVEQIADAKDDGDEAWARRPEFLLRQLQFGFHSRPSRAERAAPTGGLRITPLSPLDRVERPSRRHLYLTGLLKIADRLEELGREQPTPRSRVLLVGELREELGTFRTRIASALNRGVFTNPRASRALTADIGLKLRVQRDHTTVLCTTCDLDNDLADVERFHEPRFIQEVCVKGEDEAVFYNCSVHEPLRQLHPVWIERVERFDPFGP